MTRYFQKTATRNKFINKILALHPGKTFEEIIPKTKFNLDSIYNPPEILSRSKAYPKSEARWPLHARTLPENIPQDKSMREITYMPVKDDKITDRYVYKGQTRWRDHTGRLRKRGVDGLQASGEGDQFYASPHKRIAATYMDNRKSSILLKIDTSKVSKVGPPTDHLGTDYKGVIDMSREEAAALLPKGIRIGRGGMTAKYERIVRPKDNVEYVNAVEEVLMPDANGVLQPMKFKSPLDKALFVDSDVFLPRIAAKNRYFDPVTKTFKNKLDDLYT